MGAVLAIFIGLFVFLMWLIPIVMIAKSDRTSGNEKIAWVLLTIFVSWFAWVFYLLLAPLKEKAEN